MAEIRPIRVDEMEEAIRLCNEIFRDSEQVSMHLAFPQIFSKSITCQSYVAIDDSKIVSFMGLVPTFVHIGDARIKVFSVGSVCTHPDYRGKGYASDILNGIISQVDRANAALVLVSGGRSLYTRANCTPFGKIKRFIISPTFVHQVKKNNNIEEMVIREISPTDWLELTEIAASRVTHFEQSVWDLARLIQAEAYASCLKQSHKVLVAELNGRIQAFVVVGVPYPGSSHKSGLLAFEWAGRANIVGMLFAEAVHRYDLTQLNVPVAWYEHDLIDELISVADYKTERNLGTVKVIDAERFIEQLRPYLYEKDSNVGSQLIVKQQNNNHITLSTEDEDVELSQAEFVSLMFDPEPNTNNKLSATLRKLFPVPFPNTGGLNYV